MADEPSQILLMFKNSEKKNEISKIKLKTAKSMNNELWGQVLRHRKEINELNQQIATSEVNYSSVLKEKDKRILELQKKFDDFVESNSGLALSHQNLITKHKQELDKVKEELDALKSNNEISLNIFDEIISSKDSELQKYKDENSSKACEILKFENLLSSKTAELQEQNRRFETDLGYKNAKIEELRNVLKASDDKFDVLEKEYQVLNRRNNENLEHLTSSQKTIDELNVTIKDLEVDKVSLTKDVEKLKFEVVVKNNKFLELEKKYDVYVVAKNGELATINKNLSSKDSELRKLKDDNRSKASDILKLEKLISSTTVELQEQNRTFELELGEKNSKIEEIKNVLKATNDKFDVLQTEHDVLVTRRNENLEQLASSQKAIDELNLTMKNFERDQLSLRTETEKLKFDVEEKNNKIKELEKKYDGYVQAKNVELAMINKNFINKFKELDKVRDELQGLNRQFEAELTEKNSKIEELKNILKVSEDKCDVLEKEYEVLGIRRIADLKQLTSSQKAIDELKLTIKNLELDQVSLRTETEKLKFEIDGKNNKVLELEKKYDDYVQAKNGELSTINKNFVNKLKELDKVRDELNSTHDSNLRTLEKVIRSKSSELDKIKLQLQSGMEFKNKKIKNLELALKVSNEKLTESSRNAKVLEIRLRKHKGHMREIDVLTEKLRASEKQFAKLRKSSEHLKNRKDLLSSKVKESSKNYWKELSQRRQVERVLTKVKKDLESKIEHNRTLEMNVRTLQQSLKSKVLELSKVQSSEQTPGMVTVENLEQFITMYGNSLKDVELMSSKIKVLEKKNSSLEKELASKSRLAFVLKAKSNMLRTIRQNVQRKNCKLRTKDSQIRILKNTIKNLQTKLEVSNVREESLNSTIKANSRNFWKVLKRQSLVDKEFVEVTKVLNSEKAINKMLEDEVINFKREIGKLKNSIAELEEKNTLLEASEIGLRKNLERFKEMFDQSSKNNKLLIAQISELERKNSKLIAESECNRKKIFELEKSIEKLEKELSKSVSTIAELKVKNMFLAGAYIPSERIVVLERELQVRDGQLKKLKDAMAKISGEKKNLENKSKSIQVLNEVLEKRWHLLETSLDSVTKKNDDLQTELDKLKGRTLHVDAHVVCDFVPIDDAIEECSSSMN